MISEAGRKANAVIGCRCVHTLPLLLSQGNFAQLSTQEPGSFVVQHVCCGCLLIVWVCVVFEMHSRWHYRLCYCPGSTLLD